jgi:hypothetical protein
MINPRFSDAALQADRDPAHGPEIYRRFDSELLE